MTKKNWTPPKDDPASFFPKTVDLSSKEEEGVIIKQKTVIFVRHGESTWNDTFNRGDRSKVSFLLNFIPNLMKALFYEIYFFATCQSKESWFYDSPLSNKGVMQARNLQKFLNNTNIDHVTTREAELLKVMVGKAPSHFVVSNLRRAISTVAIGFQSQLSSQKKNDDSCQKIFVLPQLQEMSRNPDALCITPAGETVELSWSDPTDLIDIYEKQIDTITYHTGNKPVNSSGLERMQDFCRLIFDDDSMPENAIVATGHSLWFRSFFQTFLPRASTHISKKKKIPNGGAVGFTLYQKRKKEGGGNDHYYMIDPKSIQVIYGGF